MTSVIQAIVRATLAVTVAFVAMNATSRAATLRVVAETPEMKLVQGAQSTKVVPLKLTNSESTTTFVAVWLATLQILPDATAVGSAKFLSASQPDDYFMKDLTPFGPQLVLGGPPPTLQATFSDAAFLSPTGAPVPAQATVSLFDVTIELSPDALGKFRVVMLPFDLQTIESSSWSLATNAGTQLTFDNGEAGDGLTERTLATIEIIPVPEPSMAMLTSAIGVVFLRRRRGRMSAQH
jgi:hypothetical protein